jgi:hypothetical protein
MKPFWIVYSEHRGPSQYPYRHATQQQAIDEALRLCRAHGGTFIVLQAEFMAKRVDVALTRLSDSLDIPF